MQIIALSLPAGVIVFAMIALFVVGALNQPPTGMFISLFAVAFAFAMFAMHLVMPQLIASRASHLQIAIPESLRPYGVYQAQMIVKLALLEGAAFFNVICSIIEHNWWSLGIAGLLVGWMLTQFPTRDRVERWIATQGKRID
ncbi:MAG: hypothetical protein U0992_09580 [Planctomycetaceae bacterium]